MKFGNFNKHMKDIKQYIFIRHGEKASPALMLDLLAACMCYPESCVCPPQISDAYPDLNAQGYFRANNLALVFGAPPAGSLNTPDIIYAMQQGHVRSAVPSMVCSTCPNAARSSIAL